MIHKLNIAGLENPTFDDEKMLGYLSSYYPTDSMPKYEWREEYHSRQILDYKQGQPYIFDHFLKPFVVLIEESVKRIANVQKIIFVPVPPSKSQSDPKYNQEKHLDSRNIHFCAKLKDCFKGSESLELIKRIYTVEEKSKDRLVHSPSLKVDDAGLNTSSSEYLFALIDDVTASGTILNVCKEKLQAVFTRSKIAFFVLGKSTRN